MLRILITIGLILCTAVAVAKHKPAEDDGFQSGYGDVPQFGGPDSVSGQLSEADRERESAFEWQAPERWLRPWFDWKSHMQDQYGVALGFFASLLGQKATDSRPGTDDDAVGGIYRFQGSWTLVNRGQTDPGRIEWRVEYRSRAFGMQAPLELGSAVGAKALNTGFPYSRDFDVDLAVLNWTQGFRDETVGIAAGRLAFDVYLDAMPFQTVSKGFLNRVFVLNPTIATTGIGALGAVARGFVGDNFIVGAQIYDGNAANGEFDWDTFQEHEYLKAVDVAWTPSYARRKTDKIQFTYWDKDRREKAGVPSGSGWAVSASWKFGKDWLPFLRFGHSDGGAGVAAETAVSGGFEYQVAADQAWTFGVGWAEPANAPSGADDEVVVETSYKFQMAKNLALLSDIQFVRDPANYPTKNSVWVFGLRAIVTL